LQQLAGDKRKSISNRSISGAAQKPERAGGVPRLLPTKHGSAVEAEAHDAWCRGSSLAGYKRPREYLFVAEIPKSPVGKVLRRRPSPPASVRSAWGGLVVAEPDDLIPDKGQFRLAFPPSGSAIVVRQRFFGIFWPRFLAGYERLRDDRRIRDAAHNQHSETTVRAIATAS
jgi:hypothetical protein